VTDDELIRQYDSQGRPTFELPGNAKSVQALNEIFEAIVSREP
jgi:hypothetical protein